jgi:hypothetical protein
MNKHVISQGTRCLNYFFHNTLNFFATLFSSYVLGNSTTTDSFFASTKSGVSKKEPGEGTKTSFYLLKKLLT